jgi:FtsP/CotA-like multicopper oxidase with cupredoxin domain
VNAFTQRLLSRRNFIKGTGAAAAVTAVGFGMERGVLSKLTKVIRPRKNITMAATDGWISMPSQAAPVAPFFPDPMAPPVDPNDPSKGRFTTYIMGFRNLTGVAAESRIDFKQKAQTSAPLIYVDEGDDVRIDLWNLGLAQRPDLVDSHTIHWHGFPRQIAYFDGVPDASLAAQIGKDLNYQYIPMDPGTYMYHCHVEDAEHVQMGLSGVVFVRPLGKPKQAYHDASTAFDREFAIMLTELDVHEHFNDAHVQDSDWTDFTPTFWLMNGRAYPDTLAPNSDPMTDAAGRLRYQPLSSLIQANAGEKVLLRISNLGFQEHSLVLPNLEMKMVGRDAKPLQVNRPDYAPGNSNPGSRGDVQTDTYRLDIGPGESRDVIFTAPNVGSKTIYPLYDRNYGFANKNGGVSGDGYGGMRTEVQIHPGTTLPAQNTPHELFQV